MRILVTKLGDEILKTMAEENNALNKNKVKNQQNPFFDTNKSANTNPFQNKTRQNNTFSSSLGKTNFSKLKGDLLNKNDNKNPEELISSKEISIKQKKINIPKNLTERYNNIDDSRSFILPSLTLPKLKDKTSSNFNPNNTLSQNNLNTTTGFTQSKIVSFRDVLTDESYSTLKKKLAHDKKIKDSLSRIDETQFRSVYGQKNNMEKLDDMLSQTINLDRINLIRYLNEKENVSDVLIKRLSEYNDDKINKVNKICQIVFFNEERSKIYKERIKERIVSKHNREKAEYKGYLEALGEEMKEISGIFKDYNRSVEGREKFRDQHNDTVNNFWRKYQVSRYARKKNMEQTGSTFGDFTTNFNKSPTVKLESKNTEIHS